jgi:predicted DNA-binding transcriptional regulator AlpA
MTKEDKWITVQQYAKKHGIPRSSVYNKMWRGKIIWKEIVINKKLYKVKDDRT